MIYFLRHQRTYNNKNGIISGQTDSPIISYALDNELTTIMSHIDIIYSSPSIRCIETLRCIHNLTISPTIDNRLLERKMGDFENHPKTELYKNYPDFFRTTNNKILFCFKLTPPNGESFLDFSGRIASFCKEAILPEKKRNILICSHNQTMKMLYFILKGVQPTNECWDKNNFPNGKVVTFDF